jgi:hypothetical protein
LESEDTQARVQASCGGADRVHAELRDFAVDGADACGSAEHRPTVAHLPMPVLHQCREHQNLGARNTTLNSATPMDIIIKHLVE